jgi:hypothetical protein
MKHIHTTLAAAALALLATACTTQSAYYVTQELQKEQCRKLPDMAERQRCEKSNAMAYDKYKAESEAATSGKGKTSP